MNLSFKFDLLVSLADPMHVFIVTKAVFMKWIKLVLLFCSDMNGSLFFLTLVPFYLWSRFTGRQGSGISYLPEGGSIWVSSFVGRVTLCDPLVWLVMVFEFMEVGRLGLGYCRTFFCLGQGMWGILWRFGVCVSWAFWLRLGVFGGFLKPIVVVCKQLHAPLMWWWYGG